MTHAYLITSHKTEIRTGADMGHKLSRKIDGIGNLETITPTCSCGWSGQGIFSYEDNLERRLAQQERQHRKQNPILIEKLDHPLPFGDMEIDDSARNAVNAIRMFHEGRSTIEIAEHLQVSEAYIPQLLRKGKWLAMDGNWWCATLPWRCSSALYNAGYRNTADITRDLLNGTIYVKTHNPFVSSVPRLGKDSLTRLCQKFGIATSDVLGFVSREGKAVRDFGNGAHLDNVLVTLVGSGLLGPAKRVLKFVSLLGPADRARIFTEIRSQEAAD